MSNDQRNGGFDCGCGTSGFDGGKSIGAILVLFILLVIIASAFSSY